MKTAGSQSVEKVQFILGFFSYLWYNRSGDENVGKERKQPIVS